MEVNLDEPLLPTTRRDGPINIDVRRIMVFFSASMGAMVTFPALAINSSDKSILFTSVAESNRTWYILMLCLSYVTYLWESLLPAYLILTHPHAVNERHTNERTFWKTLPMFIILLGILGTFLSMFGLYQNPFTKVEISNFTLPETYTPKNSGRVMAVANYPDSQFIASASTDHHVRIWDTINNQSYGDPLHCNNGVRSVTVSPKGNFLVAGTWASTATIERWDVSGETPESLPSLTGHNSTVNTLAITPDNKFIVSGAYSGDSTIKIWDLEKGGAAIMTLRGHESSVNSVAITPDSKFIVSGSDDKTIRIWDLVQGTQIGDPWNAHNSSVNSVAISPNGQYIVSGSKDTTIKIWDFAINYGNNLLQTLKGHSSGVTSVAISSDGQYIVSGSEDKTIKIWDLLSGGEALLTLKGHEGTVESVGISNDLEYIVSGSDDKTVRMWYEEGSNSIINALSPLRYHTTFRNNPYWWYYSISITAIFTIIVYIHFQNRMHYDTLFTRTRESRIGEIGKQNAWIFLLLSDLIFFGYFTIIVYASPNFAVLDICTQNDEEYCWGEPIQDNTYISLVIIFIPFLLVSFYKKMKHWISTCFWSDRNGRNGNYGNRLTCILVENSDEVRDLVYEQYEFFADSIMVFSAFEVMLDQFPKGFDAYDNPSLVVNSIAPKLLTIIMQLYGLAVLFFTHNSTLHLAKTLEPTTMINILHEFALIFILLFPTYSIVFEWMEDEEMIGVTKGSTRRFCFLLMVASLSHIVFRAAFMRRHTMENGQEPKTCTHFLRGESIYRLVVLFFTYLGLLIICIFVDIDNGRDLSKYFKMEFPCILVLIFSFIYAIFYCCSLLRIRIEEI